MIDPKNELPKGLTKHLERRIKDLQYQLELTIPKSGMILESIDIGYIYSLKEEIKMLKNELLSLKIMNKIESEGYPIFYVKESYSPMNPKTKDILNRATSNYSNRKSFQLGGINLCSTQ